MASVRDSGHRHVLAFEQRGDHLGLSCPWMVDVDQAEPGIDNRNSMPWSRLFLVDPAATPDASQVVDVARAARHPLPPGRVLLLPPDRLYRFVLRPGLRMLAYHFRLEWAAGCDVFANRDGCRARDDQQAAIAAAYAAVRGPAGLGQTAALRGLLLYLAGLFVDHEPAPPGRMRAVLERIEAECRMDLAVADLARTAGLGREHFSRQFRLHVGLPPKEHLHRRIVQRACSRLLAGALVKEVAAELGFSSEFYFSRFFKARTGLSPREMVRQLA